MSLDNRPTYTGGCQCGAVRFRVEGVLGEASICHCRMCQKASGNFYQPLVSVASARLTWTRAEPKLFQSSSFAKRGFCPECGTPLSFGDPHGIALAIAAFDHPEEIPPTVQWGIEAKLPYVDAIPSLPGGVTEDDPVSVPFIASMVNHQHPDHETEIWPPVDKETRA